MSIRNILRRINKYAKKRRNKPIAISFPFSKVKVAKTMSKKKDQDTSNYKGPVKDRMGMLEETVDTQAELLVEMTKQLATLKRQYDGLCDFVKFDDCK